jgi:hypothetical protein
VALDRAGSVRAIGGVAVALRARAGVHPAFTRSYGDIDPVCDRKSSRDTPQLLKDLGYRPNERFNALNGSSRLVFYDTQHRRQIDVFVGEFRMCHVVPLIERLHIEANTVPLAELLMTKLQIVRLNEKDLKDIWAIVLDHDVADHDDETINGDVIAGVLANDWGFWRTTRQSIEIARKGLAESSLGRDEQAVLDTRLSRLWERIETEPKSLRWRKSGEDRRADTLVRRARRDRSRASVVRAQRRTLYRPLDCA